MEYAGIIIGTFHVLHNLISHSNRTKPEKLTSVATFSPKVL